MGGNSGPLGSYHRQTAVLIQLSNHPAFKKLVCHHTCHSSNSQRTTSSPGWTHWMNTSKHMKVQGSRVRSSRRKNSSACCCRSSKAQSSYQPAHTQLWCTQNPKGTTALTKTQQRAPLGLNNNILKVNMIMLTSGGNETENKMELNSHSVTTTTQIFPASCICVSHTTTLFFTASMGWSHKADADQDNWSHSHNSVPYPALANVASGIPGKSAAGKKPLCLRAIQWSPK